VTCSLCGVRKAKRACPALRQSICASCCGSKRLVDIDCPPDCSYLMSAREHPPAVAVRQRHTDVAQMAHALRDLSDTQSQLFLVVGSFFARYRAAELQSVIDDDVAEAARALASTLETAARGVIYEHRPSTLSAERLLQSLRAILTEAGKQAAPSFDRDAAVVLRRIEEMVGRLRTAEPSNTRAYLDLSRRVLNITGAPDDPLPAPADERPRLIVP
jgi:hypothetical protein